MARVGKDFRGAVAFTADQFDITIDAVRKMIQDYGGTAAASPPGLRVSVKLVEVALEIFNAFLSKGRTRLLSL